MSNKRIIRLTRSEFVQKFLYLEGQPFSLKDYPQLPAIYDSEAPILVMQFSRQASKSTTMAMNLIAQSVMNPYFKTLYVAPTRDQTSIFSNDKVKGPLENSPLTKSYFVSPNLMNNVLNKSLANGAKMMFRYAQTDPDRLRGISSDMVFYDETQDLHDDSIAIINETMNRSTYKRQVFAGTPKRTRGTLANRWNTSTQNEYIINCKACNHWNILDEKNIGSTGVICSKCGKLLNLANGEWVSTYSKDLEKVPYIDGYRMCVLHFAESFWVNWQKDVIYKFENMKRAQFLNEVLAIGYDDGVAPITELQIRSACDPHYIMSESPKTTYREHDTAIGLDYGPQNSENSHTVAVVCQMIENQIHVKFAKKFLGKEADFTYIHNEVPRLFNIWLANFVASDYGMGEASNSEIGSRIGKDKVIPFQHSETQKEISKWQSSMPAFILNRSAVLTSLFEAIKRNRIVFPRWEDFKPFAQDILNVQVEYDEERNKSKYINVGPDDFFHALSYAYVALLLNTGMTLDEFVYHGKKP